MTRKSIPRLLVLFFAFLTVQAQSPSEHELEIFFSHLVDDQREIWTTPFQEETWKKPQTYWFIGASGLSFTLDDEPSRSIRENDAFSGFNDVFASTPADLTVALLPVTLGLAGKWSGQERLAEFGWKSTEALVGSLIAVSLMKAVTQRPRPNRENVYGFWDGGNSFPSGHAISVWAVASVASKHYPDQKWVPWVAYPLAGLISFSRISSGHHFASDVVTGSVLGFS